VARFIALLDSSVLFSIRATNLTLHAASAGLYQPAWSAMIHDEWTRSVIAKDVTADPTKIANRRDQMDRAFPSALVTNFEALVAGIVLPDPNDRHVLAAAIRAHADVIVTFNLRHFPAAELVKYGIEAQHPDIFLHHQLTLDPDRFMALVEKARQQLKRPPYTMAEFLDGLRAAKLPILADAIAAKIA
jgi:predicted nucleic acid-binding protein